MKSFHSVQMFFLPIMGKKTIWLWTISHKPLFFGTSENVVPFSYLSDKKFLDVMPS